MKVRDPVDELCPDEQVQRRNEMQHQWWAAGEQHRIRPPHGAKCCLHEQEIRNDGPDEPLRQPLFFIGRATHSDYLERPLPDGFGRLAARLPTGQSDERNRPPTLRPFARKQHRILAHCAEVRRQPVANVNEPLLHHMRLVKSPSAPFKQQSSCSIFETVIEIFHDLILEGNHARLCLPPFCASVARSFKGRDLEPARSFQQTHD